MVVESKRGEPSKANIALYNFWKAKAIKAKEEGKPYKQYQKLMADIEYGFMEHDYRSKHHKKLWNKLLKLAK